MDIEANVQIGDFIIERRIGAGGMGIVYRARQLSLGRTVALKVLGTALSRDPEIARFRREAQAVARLSHPGIASAYFIGQDSHVCYLAMEFIDGTSLRKVIDQLAVTKDPRVSIEAIVGRMADDVADAPVVRFDQTTMPYVPSPSPDEVIAGEYWLSREATELISFREYIDKCCRIVRDAALTLAHAHGRGVVHRDIKPENLMLDRQVHVHIVDFGVARFFEDMTVTHTGQLVGTPMYMSPEQVTGRLEVDHRTDIYSLGLVLYELLTLRRPIRSPTREGILRQIVTKSLAPVSGGNRAISRDLEAVVHRAAARDPDDRYLSAADFASDLDRFLGGKIVMAVPYRYKFDDHEIVGARPPEVQFAGFWLFFASLYALLTGTEGIWHGILRRGLDGVSWVYVSTSLLGILYYLVGRGLLQGRPWSRWVGIACGALNVCLFLTYIFFLTRGLRKLTESYMLSVFVAIIICWAAVIAVLVRRQTRAWFLLADRLRSEHSQVLSGAPLRHL
jgi:serine/threonine protein kinase